MAAVLVLALFDAHLGADADRLKDVEVEAAQLLLTLHQVAELVATLLVRRRRHLQRTLVRAWHPQQPAMQRHSKVTGHRYQIKESAICSRGLAHLY